MRPIATPRNSIGSRCAEGTLEHKLLEKLHECIAETVRITVLADRGFGDHKLYRMLQTLGWDFVIRFKGNIQVENADSVTLTAAACDHLDRQHRGRRCHPRRRPPLQRFRGNPDLPLEVAPPRAALALHRDPRGDPQPQRRGEPESRPPALQPSHAASQLSSLAILHRTAHLSTLRASGQDGVPRGVTFVLAPDCQALRLWTFAGGRANNLLGRVLESMLGPKVVLDNLYVGLRSKASLAGSAVRAALAEIRAESRPNHADALQFAESCSHGVKSKFRPCLPERLEREYLAQVLTSETDARSAIES